MSEIPGTMAFKCNPAAVEPLSKARALSRETGSESPSAHIPAQVQHRTYQLADLEQVIAIDLVAFYRNAPSDSATRKLVPCGQTRQRRAKQELVTQEVLKRVSQLLYLARAWATAVWC